MPAASTYQYSDGFLGSGFGEGAVVALRLVLQKNPITCLDKRLEFLDHFDSAFVP